MSDGSIAFNRKVSRVKLLNTLRQFPVGSIKAFTHHQKNDANDALVICETALRPGIHFVAIKTVEQQDIKALRSARQLMVEQRTAQVNQARSLAAEQGIELPVGIHFLQQRLPDITEDAEQLISPVLRQLLFSLLENIHSLNERILSAVHCLAALCQQQPKYKVLMTIPGIGSLIAAAFLSEVNAEQFTNGR
ncbi:Transposase [Serratia quinivorans]|nr:Transposase [Serratia quinivorans]CAI1604129.1 Transposase [Serratia quinivorans]